MHGVEPNRLISRVSVDPHRGHRTDSGIETGPAPGRRAGGGAMPYSRSFRFPSSLIQSVVQAGESTVRTVTSCQPAARKARFDVRGDDVRSPGSRCTSG